MLDCVFVQVLFFVFFVLFFALFILLNLYLVHVLLALGCALAKELGSGGM